YVSYCSPLFARTHLRAFLYFDVRTRLSTDRCILGVQEATGYPAPRLVSINHARPVRPIPPRSRNPILETRPSPTPLIRLRAAEPLEERSKIRGLFQQLRTDVN